MSAEDRFAEALDECRLRVSSGEQVEDCVADYPDFAADLQRLIPVGRQVAQLGSDPSPEFQAKLENTLRAAMREQRSAKQGGLFGELKRMLAALPVNTGVVVLVTLLVFVGSGVTAVNASEDSLPDSPLYQVKTAREWMELALARDAEASAVVQARLVERRGQELEQASSGRKGSKVVETVAQRLTTAISRTVDQAIAMRLRGNPRPAVRALVAICAMQRRLDRLEPQAGPEIKPVVRQLQVFLDQQERRLVQAQDTR